MYGRSIADPVRMTDAERFWSKVNADGVCWEWGGKTDRKGYGQFVVSLGKRGATKSTGAHRWAYELLVGPIPEGLVLDHLCKNPRCVCPEHCEPVTQLINVHRGGAGARNAAKTHCPQGHPYEGHNLIRRDNGRSSGNRSCRKCMYESVRRYQQRKRAEEAAKAA
jgi:hypothetical protein